MAERLWNPLVGLSDNHLELRQDDGGVVDPASPGVPSATAPPWPRQTNAGAQIVAEQMTGEESPLITAVRDGVAWITLNRPQRLNALNGVLMRSLLAELEALMAAPDVRALVLTGAGRAFCAGGDVRNLDDVTGQGPLGEQAARLRDVARIAEVMHDGPKPVIAAINGACAGAGLSLAAAADLRIAAEGAVFTTAFLAVGVSGDFGGTWNLARIVGPARARQLYLESERFGAAEALAMGLVDAVVPGSELATETSRRAARIAAFSPVAVAAVLANFRDAAVLELATFLDRETLRQVETQNTPESRQAVERFLSAGNGSGRASAAAADAHPAQDQAGEG